MYRVQRVVLRIIEINRPYTNFYSLSDPLELKSEMEGCIRLIESSAGKKKPRVTHQVQENQQKMMENMSTL